MLADGVADGLIQNPAQCSLDPRSLVPGTLTAAQAEALKIYLKEVVDTNGRPVSPGMTVGYHATAGFEKETETFDPTRRSDGAEPWGGIGKGPTAWTQVDGSIRYFIERDPTYDVNNDWPQDGDVISVAAVKLLKQRSRLADADDPRKLRDFLQQGRKIILYHGFSDDQASPYRSIGFYKALAAQEHGYAALQEHARLFMVPGMGHCTGGPGPNSFDTLKALDDWVTKGVAPEAIVATSPDGTRTMPLCRFPEEARYVSGPIAAGRSWACDATDERLLKIGVDGVLAGADRDYDADRDDRRGRE